MSGQQMWMLAMRGDHHLVVCPFRELILAAAGIGENAHTQNNINEWREGYILPR